MASGTRSGKNLKNEDTHSIRCRSVGVKSKDTEDLSTSGTTRNGSKPRTKNGDQKDLRNPTSSGSAATDSYSLRSSMRKTVRKSERLEKQNLSPPSGTSKSERERKEGPSNTVRRSVRFDKAGGSTSVISKNSSKSSGSPYANKKNMESKNGKSREENSDAIMARKSAKPLKKKKLLTARSYRALLRSEKKTQRSDATRMLEKEVFELAKVNSGADDSEEVWDNASPQDECVGEKDFDFNGNTFCEDARIVEVEGSSSGNDHTCGSEHPESSHSNRKRKMSEFNDEETSSYSKCNDKLRKSSPVRLVVENNCEDSQWKTNVGSRTKVDCSVPKDLVTSELIGSSSEGRSLAVDVGSGSVDRAEGSKRAKTDGEFDSDVSVSPSRMDVDSLSLSIRRNVDTSPCKFCGKLQRAHDDSQLHELCSCNVGIQRNLSVLPEDRRELEIADSAHGPEPPSCADVKESLLLTPPKICPNACVICKQPGLLLCCDGKGCKRSFHLSCLDPPLDVVPLGIWLCHLCMKKKLEVGVYSISEGIEIVLDKKDAMHGEKHYYVKYKNLAHVHNRWIPESQLLEEAPLLMAKFNRKHQKEKIINWKKEWIEPQRLLQKRLLIPLELVDEEFSGHGVNPLFSQFEWFVKWKGLGYEHATWELGSSPFLCSPEGMILKEDFERCHREAKKGSDLSRPDKALSVKKVPSQKLSTFPDKISSELDNDHLNAINRLCEFWHKSRNALLIDDQEHIIKSILFISSIYLDCCRPFLIISTVNALSSWETEFLRLAPSMNVVAYCGNKDARKIIRTLEFYNSAGCILFQVLLSNYDVVAEDFENLVCIGWEAIIVDYCQHARISKHFELLKNLSSDFRLLLLKCPLKDNLAEHLSLLSFLDSGGEENTSSFNLDSGDSAGTFAILKERFAHYLAYERKSDSSKFAEFWVPVQLSHVQLEQYCATLVSSSIVLRSCCKVDHVGALRDILISTRKCCDHPYLVDQLLQSSLTNGLALSEYLDVGIKASGKLRLLDKLLQEIKNRGLRVVILFQSIGDARNSIGDILDDFLRQRFGADSYERVDSGLIMSKKLAALNKFNDKSNGRFVFLIENRACLPSIKLSSVDAVVIFNSDWNPLNDFRALQKISIESEFEQMKVFRLYSSFTVEEKVLAFSKQDSTLESNIRNIIRNHIHSLLSWGASHLFSKLDDFHKRDDSGDLLDNSGEDLFLEKIVSELLAQLPKKFENNSSSDCSILIRAPQSGASYSRNIILLGEKERIPSMDGDLSGFWSNLLEGRNPRWKYISEPSQRSRRKVHCADSFAKLPEADTEEVRKKRRKIVNDSIDQISLQDTIRDMSGGIGAAIPAKTALPSNTSQATSTPIVLNSISKEAEGAKSQPNLKSLCTPGSVTANNDGREKLRHAQRNLHLLLKPELSSLCGTLRLPVDVKCLAEKLLEYVMNNHLVVRDPETILQALKISLCWRAASFLKYKLDHGESLALARKYSNFECSYDQAYSVYSKLRMLKKKFSCQSGTLKADNNLNTPENQLSAAGSDLADFLASVEDPVSLASSHRVLEGTEIKKSPNSGKSYENVNPVNEEMSERGTTGKLSLHLSSFKMKTDSIEKIFLRREENLLLKQQLEFTELVGRMEEERTRLKEKYDLQLNSIYSQHVDFAIRNGKINLLNEEFFNCMSKFDQYVKCQHKKLATMQVDARHKDRQIKHHWLREVKAGRSAESFDRLPLSESGFCLEEFKVNEITASLGWTDGTSISNSVSDPALPSDCQGVDLISGCLAVSFTSGEQSAEPPAFSPNRGETHLESSSTESLTNASQVETCTVLVVTENPVPQQCTVSPISAAPDKLLIDSVIVASDDDKLHGSTDNSNGPCSSQSLQVNVPLAEISQSSGETPASVDQVPSPEVSQRPDGNQGCSSRIQTVEPLLHSADQPTTCHASDVSHHFLVQASSSTDMTTVQMMLPTLNEGGAINQIDHSTQQTEDCLQQPMINTQAQEEHLNQLFSQSMPTTSSSNSHTLTVRAQSEAFDGVRVQPEAEGRLPQNVPIGPWLPPQVLHPDPLLNELIRIRKHEDSFTKMHEDKKLQLKQECEHEMQKVRMKYDKLIQDSETEYLQGKESFGSIYKKVLLNKILAEEFRARFIENKGGASAAFPGSSGAHPSSMRQLHQVPQSQHGQRAAMALAPALVPSPATQPSVQSPSSLSAARLLTPVRPHLSSMHIARPNLHAGGETRAPAPHLQRSRPQLPLSAVQSHINSGPPQLLANKGSLPLSTPQVSPVVPHIYASRAPASGTSQPESRDTNNNDVLPRLPQPPRSEFERWLASNQTLAASESQALPSVDAPRTHSTSGVKDVVCISDDEN
ncbi:DNA helicase protein [Dioscorea alata]|uniref:DNA helicase protein n=1 Tax=Dioscorea alata TaxID=55571 RepID=A0ACB7V8T9_DIOAL|nr:DNA helicase protein [Dioscorea alata]